MQGTRIEVSMSAEEWDAFITLAVSANPDQAHTLNAPAGMTVETIRRVHNDLLDFPVLNRATFIYIERR